MGGTTSSSVPPPSTPIIKKGWLTKKGAVVESMKRRFFVLHSDWLVYYEDDSMESEKGRISIKDAKGVKSGTSGDVHIPNSFILMTKERSYIIYGETDKEKVEWVQAISKAIVQSDGSRLQEYNGY